MKTRFFAVIWGALAVMGPLQAEDRLAEGFENPPEQTKPWCYWYWISNHISKEGLTRDLEAMKRAGIGEALIGNIFLTEKYGAKVEPGPVKVLSPEWWGMVEHAIREGGRLGVDIGLFNCPGWSQSGGPWIAPEQAMRYLATSELRVSGPRKLEQKLAVPREPFQDVAVVAFPAPRGDGGLPAGKPPVVRCVPEAPGAEALVDGRLDTELEFPEGAGTGGEAFVIDLELAEPATVRTIEIFPAQRACSFEVELQAEEADGTFRTLKNFGCDWSRMMVALGFLQQAPLAVTIPATEAQRFRLRITDVKSGNRDFKPDQGAALAEIRLSGAARLEKFVEKQLGKLHQTPLPLWDAYLWPQPNEPDGAGLTVPEGEVRDLSGMMAADGTLSWEVPAGEWIIQRLGMTPTGMENSPASPEGAGLEVDKMNRKMAKHHFDSFVGELLRRMPPEDRKALKRVVADSYEAGAQNWTDGMDRDFKKRYGYDARRWLPVLSGRIVGTADQSERFLWDLRRLVADRVATEYVGGLRKASNAHGLELWLENYGHWGFPGEFLKYGSQSDRVAGEFWVGSQLGEVELRAASSCVNTYGGNTIVSAEAFTGGPPFQNAPAQLKARGDWAFSEGINHFVLHVCIHQPWEERMPGMNAPWGTEFNRHNTWFEQGKSWIDYLRRSGWLLQQGTRVVDVAYFIGEDTPKMTGTRDPELPPGRDFDYINAEVIENQLTVENGRLTLPHGTSYEVLVLPRQETMRPELLRKIQELVAAGATVLGSPPRRSPSLHDFPRADHEVRAMSAELWGGADTTQPGSRSFGKGRVFWNTGLAEVLAGMGSKPDFESPAELRFSHRRDGDTDIYFVANPVDDAVETTVALRAGARAPELWWPESGRIARPALYEMADGIVKLPLSLGPQGSVFVVFRGGETPDAPRVTAISRAEGGEGGLELERGEKGSFSGLAHNAGDYQVETSDGRQLAIHVPAVPPAMEIPGPWELRFTPGWGVPERITFERLIDWTQHPDDEIRHYSGTVLYRKTIDLPEIDPATQQLVLDLGSVRDVATVRLNDHEFPALWLAPWQVDITAAVKPGANRLEIEVANVWHNRLVADAALPADQRRSFLMVPTVRKDSPLRPAGLLGPVAVRSLVKVTASPE
jgi:hypothetical protein